MRLFLHLLLIHQFSFQIGHAQFQDPLLAVHQHKTTPTAIAWEIRPAPFPRVESHLPVSVAASEDAPRTHSGKTSTQSRRRLMVSQRSQPALFSFIAAAHHLHAGLLRGYGNGALSHADVKDLGRGRARSDMLRIGHDKITTAYRADHEQTSIASAPVRHDPALHPQHASRNCTPTPEMKSAAACPRSDILKIDEPT